MADISQISISGGLYDIKDNSAISSIDKTDDGISYTTRAGITTELSDIGGGTPIVIIVDETSLVISTSGSDIDVTVDEDASTIKFTVVA